MRIKSFLPISILIFFLTILFPACNKLTPAGFWKNYKSNLMVKNISNQGLNGRHRAMYWEATNQYTFNANSIIAFATKNGWALTDSLSYSANKVAKWKYLKENIFPLTSKGFDPEITVTNGMFLNFPRWISSDIKVYKFKTGWITIEPGTDNANEENGLVIINNDKTKFSVYQLWGE